MSIGTRKSSSSHPTRGCIWRRENLMKEFANIADTEEELSQIKFFLTQIHSFTVDYMFALRKVLPMLKCEGGKLSDKEREALISYISKLDMRMTTIFFNSLKYLDPISASLINDELELYDATMKEMSGVAEGDEWKFDGKLGNKASGSSIELGDDDRKEFEQLMQSLSSKKKRPPTASEGNPQQSEKKDVEKPKKGKAKKSEKLDDKAKEGFFKQLGDAFMEGFNAAQEPKKKPRKSRKKDDEKKED